MATGVKLIHVHLLKTQTLGNLFGSVQTGWMCPVCGVTEERTIGRGDPTLQVQPHLLVW